MWAGHTTGFLARFTLTRRLSAGITHTRRSPRLLTLRSHFRKSPAVNNLPQESEAALDNLLARCRQESYSTLAPTRLAARHPRCYYGPVAGTNHPFRTVAGPPHEYKTCLTCRDSSDAGRILPPRHPKNSGFILASDLFGKPKGCLCTATR